jgi:UDPglucose 6-dehydrogenase
MQFIGVGTPPDEDGSADLQYVLAAARSIGRHMTDYKVIVDKSTVPVGTADRCAPRWLAELAKRAAGRRWRFAVVSNPEFLKEGAAVEDFMRPDRIVVGADDEQAILLMRALYQPFMRNHDRLMVMDVRSAEFTKYAANAMLATRISFMNELALLAEKVGADIEHGAQGHRLRPAHRHALPVRRHRLRRQLLPKDVKALVHTAARTGVRLQVLEAVEAGQRPPEARCWWTRWWRASGGPQRARFALWGLAFKPNTDDMREAPSPSSSRPSWPAAPGRPTTRWRCRHPRPAAGDARHARAELRREGWMPALEGADALLMVTEWKERFPQPRLRRHLWLFGSALKEPVIFDGRNLYEPEFEGERIDLVLWSTALDPEPKPIHQIALMQGLKIADGQGAAG